MRHKTGMKLIAAMLVLVSGCSFFVMRPPVERAPAPPECSSTRWVPGYDLFAGGASLVAASQVSSDGGMGGSMQAILAVSAIPYLISAVYGFSQAGKCRAAKSQWEREVLPRLVYGR